MRFVATVAFSLISICGVYARDKNLHTSRYYVGRAEDYIQANAWDAAKREIDDGLELYPDDPDLRYLNGRYYYYAQGDLNQARYNLVKAVQENDQHYHAKRVLVDVEDDSKHYSSAICYINELLEFQPYDRDLWRRKISLYNKIGHKVEAESALERLSRIYPQDSVVRKDLSNRNRENWNVRLQRTSLTESAATLENWLDLDPDNLEYYIELVGIYERLGEYERAIGTANRGLARFPGNVDLVRRAASIMGEMGYYTRALAFVKQNRNSGPLYNNLLREAANDARMKDPYDVTGRLYDITGDREALTYLLNTSITRGYYDDAKHWLNEAYRKDGQTADLIMKEYALEKRFGNEQATYRLLVKLYELNPQDEDITEEYALMMVELANRSMADEQWRDASTYLQRAITMMNPDSESWPSAVSRQIMILGQLNRFDEARELYEFASLLREPYRRRFGSAYEDVAATRLKALIEVENYKGALKEAEDLLSVVPDSEVALRTCVNMSQTLKLNDKFVDYADRAYELYPNVPYFIVKEAVALQQRNREDEALELLKPREEDDEFINPQLINAHSGITQEWAVELLKEKMPDRALEKLDKALEYDPVNTEMLYLKGLAHEQLKQYDLAYKYQHDNYDPSNAEQLEWYQHMRYLRFRGYRNRVDVSYTYATYDNRSEDLSAIAHLYSLATFSYSRLGKRDTFMGQISYKGIDGYHIDGEHNSGGVGLEFMAQWDHTFNHRWSMMLNGAYSLRYFNKWGVNASLSYTANRNWVISLRAGYRLTPQSYLYLGDDDRAIVETNNYNMFLVTPSVAKTWDRIYTSLSLDAILLNKSIFYNVGWKGKIFVNDDNISSVGIAAGFGSFPELTFYEQTALQNFSHSNAMLGFDIQWMFTHNLYLGLSGSWNTCYSPYQREDGKVVDSFRNIYSIGLQMHVAF